MPKPSFRILLKDYLHPDPDAMHLCVDAGPSHMSLSLFKKSDRQFVGYEFYPLAAASRMDDTAEILAGSPILDIPVGNVLVTYNTPESVLIPGRLHRPEIAKQTLNIIHGDLPSGNIMQEHVQNEDIFNVYRVPGWLHEAMSARFPKGRFWHVYSAILKVIDKRKEDMPETLLYAMFYPGHVILTLLRDGKLMIIQSFPYEIPEDVSYTLLNVTQQFGLDSEELTLWVSGLIEKDSIVYQELLKYFMIVEPDNGNGMFRAEEVFTTYPDHYFTPAFSLCLCE